MMALAMTVGLGVATRTHAQSLTTGTIAGTVSDANGNSLPGVQISVDTGQMDVTNASGKFVISDILPGTHTVQAALVGFQTVSASVNVTQELTSTVDLVLSKRETVFTGVQTVIAPLIHKNVTPTLYTVTSKEEQLVRSQPNNLYQYPGALISQPGIIPDADGYPSVRGSRIQEVGYMLDGILIVEPSSGGFATNLVTVGLDRMNVYTGGYRAELGSAIGGIINSVVKTGASMRGQAAVEASTGSWDYSGLVYEQGNVEKNGFNWYVSGNFFRTRFEKNHQLESLPASNDEIIKLIQPFGKKDRFTLMYTNGAEHYNLPVNDPYTGKPWADTYTGAHIYEFNYQNNAFVSTPLTQDYQVQQHNIGSLTWNHQFTNTSGLTGQFYSWDRRVDANQLSSWDIADVTNRDKLNAGKLDFTTQMGPAFTVRIGGEMVDAANRNALVQLSGDFNDPASLRVSHRVRHNPTLDRNGYLSTTWKPTGSLVIDAGLRYDSRRYDRSAAAATLSTMTNADRKAADEALLATMGAKNTYSKTTPRIGATLTLSPKTLLKASAGRFIQFAPANLESRYYVATTGPGGNTRPLSMGNRRLFDVKPEIVDGYDVGIETQLSKVVGLAITPYYRKTKDAFNYTNFGQYDPTDKQGFVYNNSGHGKTRGVETKLEMREVNGLSGWITYTYQTAKSNVVGSLVTDSIGSATDPNAEHRLNFDQKHTIYVVGKYNKGAFEINPMLELGSGYPYGQPGDGPTGAGYGLDPNGNQTTDELPIIVNGKLNTGEVNPFNTGWHKNLSVTFRLYNNKQKSSYYFMQVQNLTNSKDVTAKFWQNPLTGTNTYGYVPTPVTVDGTTYPAHFEYKTWTTVPPIFVLIGVHQTF
jgi:hypothetical protein